MSNSDKCDPRIFQPVDWQRCDGRPVVITYPAPPPDPPIAVTIAELREMCLEEGFTLDELRAPGRMSTKVEARSKIAKLLRLRRLSFPEIAELLGWRDHTSAMHAVKRSPRPIRTRR